MSTFGSFSTVKLGIYAAQKGLDVTGNNITNINTTGYTRQRLDQVSLMTEEDSGYVLKFKAVEWWEKVDSITNVISPVLGMLLGGLEIAKIPYDKYVKWVMPLVLTLLVYSHATLYFMGVIGWTGL